MLFCRLLIFFKIKFFENFFQEYHQSIKQFGSRSGPTFHWGLIWVQIVCKGYQQMTLIGRVKMMIVANQRRHYNFWKTDTPKLVLCQMVKAQMKCTEHAILSGLYCLLRRKTDLQGKKFNFNIWCYCYSVDNVMSYDNTLHTAAVCKAFKLCWTWLQLFDLSQQLSFQQSIN